MAEPATQTLETLPDFLLTPPEERTFEQRLSPRTEAFFLLITTNKPISKINSLLKEILAYYFSSKKKHHDEGEDLNEDTAAVDVDVTGYMDEVNESMPDASFG